MTAPTTPPHPNTEYIECLTRALKTAADKGQWREAGGISALLAALEEEMGQPGMAQMLRVQAELFFVRAAEQSDVQKQQSQQRIH